MRMKKMIIKFKFKEENPETKESQGSQPYFTFFSQHLAENIIVNTYQAEKVKNSEGLNTSRIINLSNPTLRKNAITMVDEVLNEVTFKEDGYNVLIRYVFPFIYDEISQPEKYLYMLYDKVKRVDYKNTIDYLIFLKNLYINLYKNNKLNIELYSIFLVYFYNNFLALVYSYVFYNDNRLLSFDEYLKEFYPYSEILVHNYKKRKLKTKINTETYMLGRPYNGTVKRKEEILAEAKELLLFIHSFTYRLGIQSKKTCLHKQKSSIKDVLIDFYILSEMSIDHLIRQKNVFNAMMHKTSLNDAYIKSSYLRKMLLPYVIKNTEMLDKIYEYENENYYINEDNSFISRTITCITFNNLWYTYNRSTFKYYCAVKLNEFRDFLCRYDNFRNRRFSSYILVKNLLDENIIEFCSQEILKYSLFDKPKDMQSTLFRNERISASRVKFFRAISYCNENDVNDIDVNNYMDIYYAALFYKELIDIVDPETYYKALKVHYEIKDIGKFLNKISFDELTKYKHF
jgi:hypothetical protein